jgi:hypothetical protein
MSRQPILKTLERDHEILIANCVRARANQGRMAELLRLLQIGHCANQQAFNSSTDHGGGTRRSAK